MDIDNEMVLEMTERLVRAETHIEGLRSDMVEVKTLLSEINLQVAQKKGFWGAVITVGAAVWAFTTFAWDHLVTALRGG
jgi:hypothetical protein